MPRPPKSNQIRAVHTAVPGRLRIEVAGLYRATNLAKRLERALSARADVRSAKANVLTGRLLIVYRTSDTELNALLEDIIALVRAHAGPRRLRSSKKARRQTPGVRQPLAGFEHLPGVLRSLIAPPFAGPAFAAISAARAAISDGLKGQQSHPWHTMDAAQIIEHMETSVDAGLSVKAADTRLRLYGPNSLEASKRRSDLAIFVGQFNSLPVGLLGVSAVIAVMTGGVLDAAVIMGVVMINSVIGFVTERQAETTIAALGETGVRTAQVLRDGEVREIDVRQLVPGDIFVLTPGTYVSADLRLLNGHRLSIDESALTGESLPVSKAPDFVGAPDTALGDRVNMAYMGTHVTGGSGSGVVIATAKASELGKIQTMVGEAEAPETPMQKQLDRMGTQLALLSGAVCAGVFGVGILRKIAWLQMLKSSVSLAVAAVPEGLPAVATTTLAMGINDMRKRNVAVRHLDAVESLGSVQVFCLDKTGTLTMNRMAVVSVHAGDRDFAITEGIFRSADATVDPLGCEEVLRLMQVASLCSEVTLDSSGKSPKLEGSATESALVQLAVNAGLDVPALRDQYPTARVRYRAEGRPYMSTLHTTADGKHLLAVKGSPEELLALCDDSMVNGERVPLDDDARARILAGNDRMAGDALRVLGVAYRDLDSGRMPSRTGRLTWLGLAGMADPMRPGMDKLMAMYHRAGIRTVMITGDQSATAQAIGRQLGLSQDGPLRVLESGALEAMDIELLAGLAKDVHVFARVSPAHKLKIVQALQHAGMVVAMTGDGINDGPALKAADIGVAMGKSGTDVARSVSDVVLEDDNLHTMEVAVRQGRTIYNNIRKTIHFMVSTNLTEIEVMLAGIGFGLGEPLNPMQLLWINLVTDIFPGLALSMEPPEPDIMERPPRDPKEAIIRGDDLKRMLFESGVIGVGTMAAFLYGRRRYGVGAANASTLAFTTLTVNELAHSLSARSKNRAVFTRHRLPPNPKLTKAIGGMLVLQGVATWVPAVRRLLGTTPLNALDLLVVAGATLGPLLINEFTKPPMKAKKKKEASAAPADEVDAQEGMATSFEGAGEALA